MEKVEQNWKKSRIIVRGDICLKCFIFLYLLLGYKIFLYYFTQGKGSTLQNSQDSHIWLCRPWPAEKCLAKESQWGWNAVHAHLLRVPVQGCSCLKQGVSPAEYFPFASTDPLPTTYPPLCPEWLACMDCFPCFQLLATFHQWELWTGDQKEKIFFLLSLPPARWPFIVSPFTEDHGSHSYNFCWILSIKLSPLDPQGWMVIFPLLLVPACYVPFLMGFPKSCPHFCK